MIDGDEAFYYLNMNGNLHGAVITHVDDINLARTNQFKEVISVIEEELTVSKIEKDVFRFTGLDMKVLEEGVEILMEDYSCCKF